MSKRKSPTSFVLDLDGVFTDGKFHYSEEGKVMKVFGADDNEALKLLGSYINIHVITADSRGFTISQKRIKTDMGLSIELVSSSERPKWIEKNFDAQSTIYMGDGLFDMFVFKVVGYSIAPANALKLTKKRANFTTKARGADRAVAEASLHILKKFFPEGYREFKRGKAITENNEGL